MDIEIKLSGSPGELIQFLREAGYGDVTEEMLRSFQNNGRSPQIELNSAIEDGYWKAFSKVKVPTLFLAYLINKHGSADKGTIMMSYDDLEGTGLFDNDESAKRKISSRVGGLRKATDSFGLQPVMEVIRIQGDRHVILHEYAIEPLERYINRYDAQISEYAESIGLEWELDG